MKRKRKTDAIKKGVKKFRQMHVVSNTHWDREFRMSFQRTRFLLVKMMDALLDVLEQDPDYASYTLDSHSIMLEDYLAVRPENRSRVESLLKEGRLIAGPWYTLPEIPSIGQESIVRNLMRGHELVESLGGRPMKAGYTPCSWGQTGQLPQIYAGFGIRDILFYRGISPHECPAEFIWEAPDGTRALGHRFALFARYNYYYLVFRKITYGLDYNDREWFWGKDGETPFRMAEEAPGGVELLEPKVRYLRRRLAGAIDEMLKLEGSEYQYPYFLAMHGHDISWAHPKESKVIADANKVQNKVKVIHSDLEQYFGKLRKSIKEDEMTLLKGERRCNLKEGFWTYLLPATISARTYLKKDNDLTENALLGQAEPFATMAWLDGGTYPKPYLDLAWKYLLSNHTHDANAGCASDDVTLDVQYRYRQSRELSETIARESMQELVCGIDTTGASAEDHFLVLFNPLSQERDTVLPIVLDLPESAGAQSVEIIDSKGKPVDYQWQRVDADGLFVDNKWNVPQTYLSTRMRLLIDAKQIPAMGYEVYQVKPKTLPDRRSGSLMPAPNTLENENLRVEIAGNGTFAVIDKKTGAEYWGLGYLRDQGEVGNAWRHGTPKKDEIINSLGASARISIVEDGPLAVELKVDFSIELPLEACGVDRRSEQTVEVPVTHRIRLERGAKRVEVTTEFDNRVKDHWLRLMFPTGIETNVSYADSHYDVVERPIAIPDCDGWKEEAVGTYPFRSFVDLSDGKNGLALLTEGLHEFEVFDDEERSLAVSLVRSVRIKLEVAENRLQEMPDPGSQCPGAQKFRWALYPHGGQWDDSGCPRQAQEFNIPVRASQFGKNESGTRSHRYSWLTLDSDRVVLAAVKKTQKRDSLIVRLYNPSGKATAAILKFDRKIESVWRTNLNEERQGEICKMQPKSLPVRLGAKKIETFEVAFSA